MTNSDDAQIPRQGADLIRHLIDNRIIRKDRLLQDDVRDAIVRVGETAQNGTAIERLESLSLLGKALETFNSKDTNLDLRSQIQTALVTSLQPLGDWGSASDRYYLARALREGSEPWITQFAARALGSIGIQEERSRDSWAELATSRAPELSSVLRQIVAEMQESESDDRSAEANYRRITRICRALAGPLLVADIPAGPRFGEAFSALVRQGGGGRGAEALKLREEAALGLLDLLIQILRLRFETIFDSDMYRAASSIRGWWKPARPPDEVDQKCERVARLAMSGLHILARQGVRDNELRLTLTKLLDPRRIEHIGTQIAKQDLALDQDMSRWLSTGQASREVKSNQAVQELNEQNLDATIAEMLIALRPDFSPDVLRRASSAVSLYDEALSETMRNFASQSEMINQWIRALASKRSLRSYGEPGARVPFDPNVHDTHQTLQRNITVRIVSPGILREEQGRPPQILRKAIVEGDRQ